MLILRRTNPVNQRTQTLSLASQNFCDEKILDILSKVLERRVPGEIYVETEKECMVWDTYELSWEEEIPEDFFDDEEDLPF
jgi:hypothetical protein